MANTTRRRRIRRDRAEIETILKEFEKSGLSQVAFAQWKGLHPTVLGRWLRQRRAEGAECAAKASVSRQRIVPVKIRPRASRGVNVADGAIEVVLEGDRRIRVLPGFDRTTLLHLISCLEERC